MATSSSIDPSPERAIEVLERTTVYKGYFQIDRYRLRHESFAGGWTEPMVREVFERGHAVGVVLVDPDRDAVVMIEQFRPGALAARRPAWMIEIVAGIIDEGEAVEDVARREALEETGVAVTELERICDYMPSPGGSSESVVVFCGKVDSRTAGGIHGLAAEHEDILVRVVPVAEAIRLLDENRIDNAVTIIALSWLARHYDTLKRRWTTA